MSDARRGGTARPKRPAAAGKGRDTRVCVRFSSAEFAALFARMGRATGNLSDYVRRAALGRRIAGRIDVLTTEAVMAILAALRVALAIRERTLREAAVRSALAQGERALTSLLGAPEQRQ